MNIYKINFTPKKTMEFTEEAIKPIWSFLGCLYKNGQILEEYELMELDGSLCTFVTPPEDDALKAENNNIYGNESLAIVQENFIISSEFFGKNMDADDESCNCKEPSWYMLYADHISSESPVVCGDCGKTVPLYKLPFIFDEKEHYSVLRWQWAYKSIDSLWMQCLSDRFTYRQLHNPTSQLSKDGRDICSAFEEKLGKPFFYYLFNSSKTSKTCPICGTDWKIYGEKTFVDYKCDKCRLVADKTSKYGVVIDKDTE